VSKHLERDLLALEQELLGMSAMVEAMIEKSWRSLAERDSQLADEVIESDEAVNAQEVHIEEECLKIVALHQPVAIDLRRTATILKVNNDLERIADLAVNIAERSRRLNTSEFEPPTVLNEMSATSRKMLRDALNALVDLDPVAAVRVCDTDDEVDRSHADVAMELYQSMRDDPKTIAPSIHCLSVARHLERIADHATNIAEDVIYLVRGDIARHRHAELPDDDKEELQIN
jgi:phosphate transport system protein